MNYLNHEYYVGLLSAAALHGAAHQAPQSFQVITDESLREISFKNLSIHFYEGNLTGKVPFEIKRTETGSMKVASAATTAFDLIKYMEKSGGLSNVATVLKELIENIKPGELSNIVTGGLYDRTIVQRLGYVLQYPYINGSYYADEIYTAFKKTYTFRNTILNLHSIQKNGKLDSKWHIWINDVIEVDI